MCLFFCVTCNTNDWCQNNGEHRSHIPKPRLLHLEENFIAVGSHFMTGLQSYTAQPMYIYIHTCIHVCIHMHIYGYIYFYVVLLNYYTAQNCSRLPEPCRSTLDENSKHEHVMYSDHGSPRCWRRNAVGFDQVKKSDNVPAAS